MLKKSQESIGDKGTLPSPELKAKILSQITELETSIQNSLRLNPFFLQLACIHSQSKHLPENTHHDLKEYTSVLAEYGRSDLHVIEYTKKNPKNKKVDFQGHSLNEGWKLHLNVTPENIVFVSDYLLKNGYLHKYLAGGTPEDGKIFTIYIGSREYTEKFAPIIAQDLKDHLAKPTNTEETELAPGIVGRFTALKLQGEEKYHQYGIGGICLLRKFYSENKNISPTERDKNLQQAFEEAFTELIKDYGEYFCGSVTSPLEPEIHTMPQYK